MENLFTELTNEVERLVNAKAEIIIDGVAGLIQKVHKARQTLYSESFRIENEYEKKYAEVSLPALKNLKYSGLRKNEIDVILFGEEPLHSIRSKRRECELKLKILDDMISVLTTASYQAKNVLEWHKLNAGLK